MNAHDKMATADDSMDEAKRIAAGRGYWWSADSRTTKGMRLTPGGQISPHSASPTAANWKDNPMTSEKLADEEEYCPQEIEFIQCLFDRYSENGGIIPLADDHKAFMQIVRKHYALRREHQGEQDAFVHRMPTSLDPSLEGPGEAAAPDAEGCVAAFEKWQQLMMRYDTPPTLFEAFMAGYQTAALSPSDEVVKLLREAREELCAVSWTIAGRNRLIGAIDATLARLDKGSE